MINDGRNVPEKLELLEMARAELPRLSARDYGAVIVELRNKGFSFREITRWLTERGVQADHNAVYRAFVKAGRATPPHPEARAVPSNTPEDEAEAIKLL